MYTNNEIIKNASGVFGTVMDVIQVGRYIYDWTKDDYQVEEAIANQFAVSAWYSDTRDIVDEKFNYAKNNMILLMLNGEVEVKKAVEYFGSDEFEHDYSSISVVDPLTGRENLYYKNDYYFFMIDESASDKIHELEKNMRLCNMD